MAVPNAAIRRAGQQLVPGDLVYLYLIDLSPIGVNVQYAFTPATPGTNTLSYRGINYAPLDVRCEGFEMSTQGVLPQPDLSITNVTRVLSSAALQYQDLVGARVTRIKTYRQFLDAGATPDTEGAYAPEVYLVDQKTQHNKKVISWKLAASTDQEGVLLPKRIILRDICLYKYRKVTLDGSGNFLGYDYTGVECPYTGSAAYDVNGNVVAAKNDVPGRHVGNCCKKRFGANAQLPYGGFPGVGRVRF